MQGDSKVPKAGEVSGSRKDAMGLQGGNQISSSSQGEYKVLFCLVWYTIVILECFLIIEFILAFVWPDGTAGALLTGYELHATPGNLSLFV